MHQARWIAAVCRFVACAALAASYLVARSFGAEVTFARDVMAVLSKAGCNQGACHGNQNGKGGFKLSLRGENPAADYATVTRDQFGRRANPAEPDASLLLMKPALVVAHEGGRRFDRGSVEYEILRTWIAASMPAARADEPALADLEVSPREQVVVEPADSVRIAASAAFTDGTRRDVARLAVYEPSNASVRISNDGVVTRLKEGDVTVLVRYLNRQVSVRLSFVPARADFVWQPPVARNEFDQLVFARLQSLRLNSAPLSDDVPFLRRAYLDLAGVLPTAEEARDFLAADEPDKRTRLVDRLLARPEFADAFALKWADLLRGEEKQLDAKGVAVYHGWIRRSIADGKPLDQFVRELVTAEGSTYQNPPTNFYRALRDPIQRGEAAAQVFLGTRLQCAKCHNHPFDRWTQNDYYRWAALFARVDYKVIENKRRDELDKHEFNGEQLVLFADKGEVKFPAGGAADPKFLGGDGLGQIGGKERLAGLAMWMASRDNALFVRVQANRIWRQVVGLGVVEPVDDFRASNPPSNPPLLDALSRELVRSEFDLRAMIRRIADSHVYQSASVFNPEQYRHVGDESTFARAVVRRMSAEQMLDAISQTLDVPASFRDIAAGTRAGQLPGVAAVTRKRDNRPAEDFLRTFGKPARNLVCECERSDETTLAQTLTLVSGEAIHRALGEPDGRIARWAASSLTADEVIEAWYLTALSRSPTADELSAMRVSLSASADRRAALEDIAWAVLNSKEFVFRH